MFLVQRCHGCGADGRAPCDACWAALSGASLRLRVAGLDSLVACADYRGPAGELVGALKFRGAHRLAPALARAMAAHCDDAVDALCWIPAAVANRRRRGYDQGALLARALGGELGVRSRRLLRRGRGPPQLGLSRRQRQAGRRCLRR